MSLALPIHTSEQPFCEDSTCACQRDAARLARYCGPFADHVESGLLSPVEAARLARRFCFDVPPVYTPGRRHVTAWLPLDALAEQWAGLGIEFAGNLYALQATSTAFAALAHESTARRFRGYVHTAEDEMCPSPARSRFLVLQYQHAQQALHEAERAWHQVQTWLDQLANQGDPALTALQLDVIRLLIDAAHMQGLRLHVLLAEVTRDVAAATQQQQQEASVWETAEEEEQEGGGPTC